MDGCIVWPAKERNDAPNLYNIGSVITKDGSVDDHGGSRQSINQSITRETF
jgi:hypothetical protein